VADEAPYSESVATKSAPPLGLGEHYKLLIEDARGLGDRRETLNDLFLGLITLILGAQGYLMITTKDSDLRATIYIIAVGAFGYRLAWVWAKVLESYKALLNFRYHVLKEWERALPENQRYYISEDALYDAKLRSDPPTTLVSSYLAELRNIHPFVNVYKALPSMARIAYVLLVAVRLVEVCGGLILTRWLH
jgi:hypothetical protein